MYKIINNISVTGESFKAIIRDNGNGSFTSFLENLESSDYQAYLAWIDEGNEPLTADEVQA